MSLAMTRPAPRSRANMMCIAPIGPTPITTTPSPGPMPTASWPRSTQANGSVRAATAGSTPAAIGMMLPWAMAAAGMRMYSAKPPSRVMPTAW